MYLSALFIVVPDISPEVIDQVQNKGDTASFMCQATGDPVPTINWYFNGTPVNESDVTKYTISEVTLNNTAISNTLTIMSVQSSDAGTYTCNATNVASSTASSGVLTVNGNFYWYSINRYFIACNQYILL